jgi:DNA-binding NarL/FixJ family response regulator
MGIRTVLVDSHTMVREGFCCLLNREFGMEVVGQAGDGRAAVEIVKELKPDVVIMSVFLPSLNGFEAARKMRQELPGVKVLALSEHADRRSVREMLKAGASGFVSKRSDFGELISAIRSVASNQTYLSPQISGMVVEGYINRAEGKNDSAYSVLTSREREVLQLIAEGKTTKSIAKELFVSIKTVEWHRSQIMKKVRAKSIAELVKYAINEGLTPVFA